VKAKDARTESELTAMADSAKQTKATDLPAGAIAGNKSGTAPSPAKLKEARETSVANTGNKETTTSGNATADAEKQNGTQVVKAEDKPVLPPDLVKINTEYKKRKQIVSKLIDVGSDSVRLSFYDNAEVDGDSISVFLNGALVVAHQGLTERAFNVYVKLDSTKDVNEVSMFAENLGKYPPNTALMVISDGEKRYETYMSSDFNGNATIRLRHRRNGIAGAGQ